VLKPYDHTFESERGAQLVGSFERALHRHRPLDPPNKLCTIREPVWPIHLRLPLPKLQASNLEYPGIAANAHRYGVERDIILILSPLIWAWHGSPLSELHHYLKPCDGFYREPGTLVYEIKTSVLQSWLGLSEQPGYSTLALNAGVWLPQARLVSPVRGHIGRPQPDWACPGFCYAIEFCYLCIRV
jgi:hypothetical protein